MVDAGLPAPQQVRSHFLLDPDWVFLNHGSFGACPAPVFERYQDLQRELEWQPLEFLDRTIDDRLAGVRSAVADFLSADAESEQGLAFVPNATTGITTVARSLPFEAGDEILCSDQEYGACTYTWERVALQHGARVRYVELPTPLSDVPGIVAAFEHARTDRTKVVFVSHISAVTGAILPIVEIAQWAAAHDIAVVVDGAHAPGQIDVDLGVLARAGVSAYSGNFHKWLCSPKGAAFLWVKPHWQQSIWPLITSWGCVNGDTFLERHSWSGTHDPSAVLAVPAAIDFHREHLVAHRPAGAGLIDWFRQEAADQFGLAPVASPGDGWHSLMAACPVPWPAVVAADLTARLRAEFRIEVPFTVYRDQVLIRPSAAAYVGQDWLQTLLDALRRVLRAGRPS